jgi:opacity protein-like surface antigen
MLCRSHGRAGEIGRRGKPSPHPGLLAVALLGVPNVAAAAPGVANRLGGANAQGPATASVTGIYHNPAMLGAVPGFSFETTLRTGVDHLAVRRFDIDSDGSPNAKLGKTKHLANPAFDYFIGASFMLDPVAIGAAVHTFGSRFRLNSSDELAYHLAAESDFGCSLDPSRVCPNQRKGGMLEMRTDFDLALAWNALDFMSVGATAHFPRQRTYFARDVDSVLTGANADSECDPSSDPVESAKCAERLSFRGNTRLRWFGLNPRPSTRLDFALTVGVAFNIADRVTLGVRYRTQPLLDGGRITANGAAAVCRPNRDAADQTHLSSCDSAEAIDATVSERLPQEVAVGLAGEIGNWALDSNLYWIDRCPLGGVGTCNGRDARSLVLVGLDQDASTLPETTIYRGLQDMFGAELWARYRLDDLIGANLPYYKVLCSGGNEGTDPTTGKQLRCVPRIDLLLGGGVNSPAVKPGSLTAANSDGWTVLATFGASFNLPGRNGTWSLAPAYALDFMLPTRVGPGGHTPAFDPTAAINFEANGADLNNTASANAVLAGRGLPTNAGIYTGAVHTILFSVRWSERGLGARELPKNRK